MSKYTFSSPKRLSSYFIKDIEVTSVIENIDNKSLSQVLCVNSAIYNTYIRNGNEPTISIGVIEGMHRELVAQKDLVVSGMDRFVVTDALSTDGDEVHSYKNVREIKRPAEYRELVRRHILGAIYAKMENRPDDIKDIAIADTDYSKYMHLWEENKIPYLRGDLLSTIISDPYIIKEHESIIGDLGSRFTLGVIGLYHKYEHMFKVAERLEYIKMEEIPDYRFRAIYYFADGSVIEREDLTEDTYRELSIELMKRPDYITMNTGEGNTMAWSTEANQWVQVSQ